MRLDLPTPEVPMNTAVSPGLINCSIFLTPRPVSAQAANTKAPPATRVTSAILVSKSSHKSILLEQDDRAPRRFHGP